MPLIFKRISRNTWVPEEGHLEAYLKDDNWDDFYFKTSYVLTVFDESGVKYEFNSVKIGYFGQVELSRTELPTIFTQLDETFFSLGQSDEYYSKLMELTQELRELLLTGLNDIVHNAALLDRTVEEQVTSTSLLRDVSLFSVKNQFRRILAGGNRLNEYHFNYVSHVLEVDESVVELDFHVDPESMPPSNIHVFIGRNGAGKTHLLNSMIDSLLALDHDRSFEGEFSTIPAGEGEFFAGLVSVSFSVFDTFKIYPDSTDSVDGMPHSFIGLKKYVSEGEIQIMDKPMLADEFIDSLENCFRLGKQKLWKTAIEKLQTDSLSEEHSLSSYVDDTWNATSKEEVKELFMNMSSGHSIVLLTMTKLVEKVEEQTLVLMDEPEGHLHPPLLSAFIRSLSDLLLHKNGVAIIATHSPVILQEVPRSCVWKFRRADRSVVAERPSIETFGENVGVLTREIFGLEVTESGYHQLLKNAVETYGTYERVLRYFNDQLGSEARGIVRGMIAEQQSDEW